MANLTPEQERFIKQVEADIGTSFPDEYKFPFLTNKFAQRIDSTAPGCTQSKAEWLIHYWRHREYLKNKNIYSDETELSEHLTSKNLDGSKLTARFRGSFLGLAVGDALGTTNEFKEPGSFAPITDMTGGGPFNLKPGFWTDDTSMAYCLAHSLLRKDGFDPADQMDMYTLWWKKGVFSSTGECFDIGNTVKDALSSFEKTKEPFSGSTDPHSAGNGSLMRLAPIVLFYFHDFEKAIHFSGESSRTTHGATTTIDSCRYFGALLHGALSGVKKDALLSGLYSPIQGFWEKQPLCPEVMTVANGSYKNKSPESLAPTGYVIDSLECALWAFYSSSSFKEGALKAVNLGGDSDTIGAIYGQLAGAYYSEFNIPIEWITILAYSHVFYLKSDELLPKLKNLETL